MEVQVVEADDLVNKWDMGSSDSGSSMAIDMGLPEGLESLPEIGNLDAADLGEDWVSLFLDENYLATTAKENSEPPFYQGTFAATTLASDLDGTQPLSHSTMILSSSPGSVISHCPSHSGKTLSLHSHNVDAGDKLSPSSSIMGAVSAPGVQETTPPTRPTSSPDSTLTQASGASSSDVQRNWWGSEDQEDVGSHPQENNNISEEESSTSNIESHDVAADTPLTDSNSPAMQAEEVKSGAEPASSLAKAVTTNRSGGERNARKRRASERCEAEKVQPQSQPQQFCAESETDNKSGGEFADGADKDESDEKRQARLMRNRESAQLSRQRKKVYVDELEGKLRTMAATIAELNATISHLTAENVNLRRQLGYFYQPSRPGCVMPMMPYPGIISARPVYPGVQMPPVPIPRLKSQQTLTKTPIRIKTTKEPGEKKKAKKVASLATVGVMSLLCITMLLGPFGDWGSSTIRTGTTHIHVGTAQIRVGGRVLTSLNEDGEDLRNMTQKDPWVDDSGRENNIGCVNCAGSGCKNGINGKTRTRNDRRSGNSLRRNVTAGSERVWQSCAECYGPRNEAPLSHNLKEKLVESKVSEQVSLIVPRNNRLIKVDGNLIITAVMAGDKAAEASGKVGPSGEEVEKGARQGAEDSSKNNRSPPTLADHQLIQAVSTQAQEGGGIVVGQKRNTNIGILHEVHDIQKTGYKSDALAPSLSSSPTFSQVILGNLAGPVLSTGMCTEVFRFETSPAGAAPETGNLDEESKFRETPKKSSTGKKKRDPYAVPLPPIRRKESINTEPVVEKTYEKQQPRNEVPEDSTMVVSVFTGRQDISGEASMSGPSGVKGLSQIFVVVLVDSVKYVTYSCMLPPTGSQVHVVAS
ncbi:hypothetical protein R1sor_021209 [Riccia sorocarpa]|uniref:BZIP domain-containing protein n=1 Tax=Riccia sorocarpa TaxID=122646 RepID=A0ABD3GGE2_9MARC